MHPFVAANRSEFERDETFALLAVAEVLTEAYLHEAGVQPTAVEEVLKMRDDLLRHLAKNSKQNAHLVAQMLEDAANDEHQLELALVAAFDSMGFDAVHIGGPGKPDGVASASLSAGDAGKKAYKVNLEAKSKEKEGTKVTARTVNVSGVVRHREEHKCDHSVVVGQDFQAGIGDEPGALLKEAIADKEKEKTLGTNRTITLVRVKDLARLVRLVPLKGLGLNEIRELFKSCVSADEANKWINDLEAKSPKESPFKKILETLWALQNEQPDEPIEFSALKLAIKRDKKVDLPKSELIEHCRALERIAPQFVVIRGEKIELTQRPDKIIEAAGVALRQFPEAEKKKSIFKL